MEDDQYVTWKRWDRQPFGAPDAWYRAFFRAELAKATLTLGQDALEIGFGNGEFLAYAKRRGFAVTGVDTNETLVRAARAQGFDVYRTLDDIPDERAFDLVVAFDVLEHIAQDAIPGVLGDLRNRMRPGAFFIARFPNADSPFSRASQHGDVTHKTSIGSEKAKYFAESVGFNLVCCGPSSLPIVGAPMAKAAYATVARPLRWTIDKFLVVLYLQRCDLTFAPNLTVVLQKPV
jgi:SAM-dependent methyltransferase